MELRKASFLFVSYLHPHCQFAIIYARCHFHFIIFSLEHHKRQKFKFAEDESSATPYFFPTMSKRTHSISCFLTFSTANSTTRHFATSLIEPITLFRRWLLYRRCFRSMRAFIESFEIRWKCAPSLGFRLQVACNRRPLDQSGSTTNQNTPPNLG